MPLQRRPPLKLLITAFEPFGGRSVNASAVLLQSLASTPAPRRPATNCTYTTLPVNFHRAWPALCQQLHAHRPNAVLLLGEKSDDHFYFESMARNRRISPRGIIRIDKGHPNQLKTQFNAGKIFAASKTRYGFSKNFFKLSDDAGTYLCNFVYYKMLALKNDIPALFVHVPALEKEQLVRKLKKYTQGLRIIRQEVIKAIDGSGANYTSREN